MRFKGIDDHSKDNRPTPIEIKQLILMGDSISDRGTLSKTVLFGCLSIGVLSDLKDHSPDGRFTTLTEMREAIFEYDEKHSVSYEQKEETLIIEWSGANDLVKVNAEPSMEEVDKAIVDRVGNIKKLIAKGYRNFMIVNQPNLALSPRYQAKSMEEQDNAQNCSTHFNLKLRKACIQLAADYPHCSIDAFDINTLFEHIYHNPQKYMIDKNKLRTPYISSKDFKKPSNDLSPSTSYMFYDDIHPTADVHALMASYFYDRLSLKYELLDPRKQRLRKRNNLNEDKMLSCFRRHYKARLERDMHSFFSSKKRSNLNYKEANLETILRHALKENGGRTLSILTHLGWLDRKGRLILNEPVLKKAMESIIQDRPSYTL